MDIKEQIIKSKRKKPKTNLKDLKILDTETGKKVYGLLMEELEGDWWLADVAVAVTRLLESSLTHLQRETEKEVLIKLEQVLVQDEDDTSSIIRALKYIKENLNK